MNLSSFGGTAQSPQFHAHSARPSAHALNSAGEASELARQLGAGNLVDSLSRGGSISAIPRTAAPSASDLLRQAPQSVRTSATDAYDKAASFSSYSEHNETEFSLELRTREGDVVSLNFRQLDYRSSAQGNGGSVSEQGLERLVNMSVTGDLSDAEFAAIDRMLNQVTDEAASFFEGDLLATGARLTALDFDSEQLASFALDFTRTSQIQLTQVYTDSNQSLSDLASRDSGVASLLEMLAATQRQLMEDARSLFDAPSSAKFARSLIPELFSFGDETKATAV